MRDLLALAPAERGDRPEKGTIGLYHTAFLYPTRGQLGAALRRMARRPAPLTGARDHLVSESLYCDDPDGLGVELYRDRPPEEWPPPGPGERVHMEIRPLDCDALEAQAGGGAEGARLGHVHLNVSDLEASVRWWEDEVGLELMSRWEDEQAAFLAAGGYHHHVGINVWKALAAAPEGPGIDAIVLAGTGRDARLRTPDGVAVVLEP